MHLLKREKKTLPGTSGHIGSTDSARRISAEKVFYSTVSIHISAGSIDHFSAVCN